MNQPNQQMQSAAQQSPKVPPGWYPDPMGGSGERYWDGIAWSEHFTRQPPQQQPPPQAMHAVPAMHAVQPMSPAEAQFVVVPNHRPAQNAGEGNGLVVAGWVFAILIPIIGLIIGLVVASKNDDRGKWIIAVSVGIMVLGYLYVQGVAEEMNVAVGQGASGATGAVPPPQ